MKQSLIRFKKFNVKDQIALVFKKNWDQIETKKLEDQLNIFIRKHELKE